MAALRTAGIARLAAVAVATALAAAACAPLVRETAPPSAAAQAALPEGFPADHYARSEGVLRIDSARSLVAITVRRGGSLGHLGHDHIVASRAVQGYVAPREGRADLFIPLAELTVDEPALRAEAGLDTQPSASDIAGTRSNMLDKVLEVQRFPFATLRVDRPAPDAPLAVAITLHGVRRSFHRAGRGRRPPRRAERRRHAGIQPVRFRHRALLDPGRRHPGAGSAEPALQRPGDRAVAMNRRALRLAAGAGLRAVRLDGGRGAAGQHRDRQPGRRGRGHCLRRHAGRSAHGMERDLRLRPPGRIHPGHAEFAGGAARRRPPAGRPGRPLRLPDLPAGGRRPAGGRGVAAAITSSPAR